MSGSGEGIVGLKEEPELVKFRDFLLKYFDEIRIVAYLRTPAEFMASAFQQRVKAGIRRLILANLYPKYKSRFKKFDRVFGRDNVHLWKFDPHAFPEGNVVIDFCRRLGIRNLSEQRIHVNQRLSREAAALLFTYYKFGPGFGTGTKALRENRRLLEIIQEVRGGKFQFASEAIGPVLDANADDIKWAEERIGQSLSERVEGAGKGIKSEDDLVQLAMQSAEALQVVLAAHNVNVKREITTPRDVARLIHVVRMKIIRENEARASGASGKPANRAAGDKPNRAPKFATATNRHFYEGLPDRSFWMRTVAGKDSLNEFNWYRKKFDLGARRIATAGSCFAQHIGRFLRQSGFRYLDTEPPPAFLDEESRGRFGYGMYSARYGNIYTSRQLLQLFQRAYGEFVPKESAWPRDGGFVDPFRPTIESEPLASADEVERLRGWHLARVREVFENAGVFIFTLGLTEAWESAEDGAVFPLVPGTAAGGVFDQSRYRLLRLDYIDVLRDLREFIKKVRAVNGRIRFILTVSPVPLLATASGDHVAVATTDSKSILRAVAGELSRKHRFVDYFPAYEIIASPVSRGKYFNSDLRSVSPEGVNRVMAHFLAEHEPPGGVPADENAAESTDDEICDELLNDPSMQ